jgi:hypothetical protein
MTAIRKLLSLARIGATCAPAFPMIARPAAFDTGASTGALRLYSLPRGVRQR